MSALNTYLISINVLSFLLFLIDRIRHDATGKTIKPLWLYSFITIIGGSVGTNLYFLLFFPKFKRSGAKRQIAQPAHDYYSYWRIFSLVFLLLHVYIYIKLVWRHLPFFDSAVQMLNHYIPLIPALFVYLTSINVVTFILFWVDKKKALITGKQKTKRIRIFTLLLFAFLGGSFGALIAMRVFNHKTRKQAFVVGIPMMIVIHVITVIEVILHVVSK